MFCSSFASASARCSRGRSRAGPPAASTREIAVLRSFTSLDTSAHTAWSWAVRLWSATFCAISHVFSSRPAARASRTTPSSSSDPAPSCRAFLSCLRDAMIPDARSRQARTAGPRSVGLSIMAKSSAVFSSLAAWMAISETPTSCAISIARLRSAGSLPSMAVHISSCRFCRSRWAFWCARAASRCANSSSSAFARAASAGASSASGTPTSRAAWIASRILPLSWASAPPNTAARLVAACCRRSFVLISSRASSPSRISAGSVAATPFALASERDHCSTVASSRMDPWSVACRLARASSRRCASCWRSSSSRRRRLPASSSSASRRLLSSASRCARSSSCR
mmetsp:Transcript_62366/g.175875  ORF Transcript_62366/g.175875 Transcript_62366/m.175875 type:complete len:341 (-) Transcript_62366:276-1298(-)